MKYSFRVTSPTKWIMTFVLTILVGISIAIIMLTANVVNEVWQFILIIVPFIILAFLLPRFVADTMVEAEMDDSRISLKYQNQFVFNRVNNISLKWDDLKDYIFEKERQFDRFSITLFDNSIIRVYHNNGYDLKDDFLNFINAFKLNVSKYNSVSENRNIKIGNTFYESTSGLLFAIFIVGLLISFTALLLSNSYNQHSPNYAGIIIIYLGGLFFLFKVIDSRKNKKK